MTEWTLSSLHQEAYGQWAGMPEGMPPDPARCCANVHDRFISFHQCNRRRGYGPEKAYCKQHDPAAVKERRARSDAKQDAAWQKRRIELSGQRFFAALCKIADGDNDPRQTALEAIKDYRK